MSDADSPAPTLTLTEVTVESSLPLPDSVDEAAITSLVAHVLREERATGNWSVAFQFTSDDDMQRMHLEFMGLDSPTDIMTFPYEADDWSELGTPLGSDERGGDIVISVDRAREQASEAEEDGWTVTDELFFLVCHGLLHLLDWDDATPADRSLMLARQHELLRSWRAAAT